MFWIFNFFLLLLFCLTLIFWNIKIKLINAIAIIYVVGWAVSWQKFHKKHTAKWLLTLPKLKIYPHYWRVFEKRVFSKDSFRPIIQHIFIWYDKCFIMHTERFTVVFFVMDMDYNMIKKLCKNFICTSVIFHLLFVYENKFFLECNWLLCFLIYPQVQHIILAYKK